MTQVTITLYHFDELSDKAKDKAREWWRELEAQDFGGFGELYESAEDAAKILGIEFRTHEVPLHGGGKRSEPNISWQLHTQGSGACFEGYYSYSREAVKRIKAEFPQAEVLHRIAAGLQTLQKSNRYQLTAQVSTHGSGVHSNTMDAEVYRDGSQASDEVTEQVLGLMRDFADWIYEYIRHEYEYRMSDENVDDAIRVNEYTFRADGGHYA